MIVEEWLLRDETSLIRQLGFDVWAIAEAQMRTSNGRVQPETSGEIGRTIGQFPPLHMPPPPTSEFDVEDFVRRAYHEIWNWRLLNKIRDYYAPSHECSTTGSRKYQGPSELTAFVLGMLSMFPDAGVTVEHVYWNGDEQRGYRVAVRWTLTGSHTGYGIYGAPSGARVRLMGLSQHHILREKFIREYTLFDEMGLMKQVLEQRLT